MIDRSIFAFVLMPFSETFDDVYNIGIKEAAAQVGVVARRLDEQMFNEGMLERIYQQIDDADIIIADMSGRNSNVFYEVGYAHAKDKICILLTSDVDDIPFDLKHRRHIIYKHSLMVLRQELAKNLLWAKSQIKDSIGKLISIGALQPAGKLEITRFTATANLLFRFDLYNPGKVPLKLQTACFHTNKLWTIRQDGKECTFSSSAIENYRYRFALSLPITQLPPGATVQLQFDGSCVVADRVQSDVIGYTHTLDEGTLLQLLINDEIFEHELHIIKQMIAPRP